MLGELLDSLLDISRLDVTGIKPEISPFELQPLFERLANSFRRAATDRRIALRFRSNTLWVTSDVVLLERMIANLISNALRYTNPGGRVLVAARRRGEQVLIEVRDNGIGIAQTDQAEIFGEFYQVGNTAREHNKGLGLGLSIVDRLARALDIQVGLRSRLGEGTTFSLRIAGSPPVFLAEKKKNTEGHAGRVHCIGHSEEMQACIPLIESWNYTVSVNDGSRQEVLPDNALILADDAFANATSLAQAPDAPLIVLLGAGGQALPTGAHALPTPVRPAKLRALLNQLQKTLSKSIP
jgi:anti-sigma regulatory factor (Ser/Thr protein kinase)